MHRNVNGNFVSDRQYAALFLLISLPFKICMLPSYLATMAGRDSLVVVVSLLLFELIALTATYRISDMGGIIDLFRRSQGFLRICIAALAVAIAALCICKLFIYLTEFLDYVSLTLFDDIGWIFVVVTLMPVLYCLSRSHANVGGRTAELCILVFFGAIFICALFNTYKTDYPLRPLMQNSAEMIDTGMSYLMWSCDFVPLAFIGIRPSPSERRRTLPYFCLIYGVLLISFYVLALRMYGAALGYADNFFARFAVYHSISDEIKVLDFPVIISWLLTAVFDLAVLTYGLRCCSLTFFSRDLFSPIALTAISAVLLFAIDSSFEVHSFFARPIRSILPWGVVTLACGCAIMIRHSTREEHLHAS